MNRLAFSVLALASLAACRDGTAPPPPSSSPRLLTIALQTAHADDGALVITLRGPDVTDIRAASASYLAYTRSVAPDEARIVVLGDLSGGALLALEIGPGHQLADYTATVEDAATRADQLREDLAGYTLTVTLP
jgi:hypothetical protein